MCLLDRFPINIEQNMVLRDLAGQMGDGYKRRRTSGGCETQFIRPSRLNLKKR